MTDQDIGEGEGSDGISPEPSLEDLWDGLLSRNPARVRQAWATLEPGEQKDVLAHLRRMASEPGWHVEQQISAQAALAVLGPHP